MAFVPTTWVDGSAPAITAAQMNRIEAGVARVYAGFVTAAGTGSVLPSGWSVGPPVEFESNVFTITHNLGTAAYAVVATPSAGYNASEPKTLEMATREASTFAINAKTGAAAGSSANAYDFSFVLMLL